ncbi:hypothetical protein HK100_011660 [Physocladia obscura]|uniref:Ankyrin repeat protein n=1 Tax=Physocladia obscura TaxID=109957 RepID=A0AAD5XGG5_9FUNG|nr:hypothetical protein HK100_011660 [Physocladia obscura]
MILHDCQFAAAHLHFKSATWTAHDWAVFTAAENWSRIPASYRAAALSLSAFWGNCGNLIEPNINLTTRNTVSVWRSAHNFATIAKLALNHGRRIFEEGLYAIFSCAIRVDDVTLVSKILDFERFDVVQNGNEFIYLAAKFGSLQVVKLLLKHPSVNPHDISQGHPAICGAMFSSNKKIIDLIASNSQVDLSYENYAILNHCAEHGYKTLLVNLLADSHRVNVQQAAPWIFYHSCVAGQIKMCFFAFSLASFSPLKGLDAACANGKSNIVAALLNHQHILRNINITKCFFTACTWMQLDTIRVLIENPRIDPSAENNRALKDACVKGSHGVVQLLLASQRVRLSNAEKRDLWIAARQNEFAELVNGELMLLCDEDDFLLDDLRSGSSNATVFSVSVENGGKIGSSWKAFETGCNHFQLSAVF